MKIWIVLPLDYATDPQRGHSAYLYAGTSVGSMSPPVTREMKQDGLGWFEAEILGPAPASLISPCHGVRLD